MELGQAATIWLARGSALLYLVAGVLMLRGAGERARIAWTAGLALYLLHVCGAFEYFYNWSHAIAYRQTAQQTAELFGIDWGGGLYLNYVFTVVWFADCVWSWVDGGGYQRRAVLLSRGIHLFLAFMFVNATVVVWVLRAFRH